MNQLTLRQIPEPLAFLLREKAKSSGQSLNKTVISLLKAALNIAQPDGNIQKKRDLDSVFTRAWTDEEAEEFKNNTAFFDEIDEELWK
jgi:hypothetical protein